MPSPQPIRIVRFDIRLSGDGSDPARLLLPYVDDVSLVDLISDYENAAGFDVPGAYAEVIIDNIEGGLAPYLLGRPDPADRTDRDAIALLGCRACGMVDCWPLETQVFIADDLVTWTNFSQPFRPHRDYTHFGPFVFRRHQYEHAWPKAGNHIMGPSS
jgi:hypothetical protein